MCLVRIYSVGPTQRNIPRNGVGRGYLVADTGLYVALSGRLLRTPQIINVVHWTECTITNQSSTNSEFAQRSVIIFNEAADRVEYKLPAGNSGFGGAWYLF